jgi:hypothetical protein
MRKKKIRQEQEQEQDQDPTRLNFCHFVLFGAVYSSHIISNTTITTASLCLRFSSSLIPYIEHQQMLSKQLTAAVIATIFGSLASNVHAHGVLVSPRSRNYFAKVATSAEVSPLPQPEHCPHCKLEMRLLVFLSCFFITTIIFILALAHSNMIPTLPLSLLPLRSLHELRRLWHNGRSQL